MIILNMNVGDRNKADGKNYKNKTLSWKIS